MHDILKTQLTECIVDWKRVKNHCRTTDNKDFTDKEPTEKFKLGLLISEHSPIRIIEFDWKWDDIPYWVSTELSRHKFEKFISTQRDDRLKDEIPRGKKLQEAPVNFDGYANMQNLIDMARKRLCGQATDEARALVEDLKLALMENGYSHEADVLVPNCIYRCGCPEFHNCGMFQAFKIYAMAKDDLRWVYDIPRRYELYNNWFLEEHKEGKWWLPHAR